MKYLPHPKAKEIPSRRTRKGERNKVYRTNYKLAKLARKQRRLEKSEEGV
jgi:hypothetical protein